MDKKLTEDQQFFNDKTLEFTKEIYDRCEEQLNPLYDLQKKNRDYLLSKIAAVLLSYNIADNVLLLSGAEKKKLYLNISNSIAEKMKTELKLETNSTKGILMDAGKLKYSTNNYIYSLGIDYKLTQVDDKTLDNIINNKVENKLWSDRLWENKNETCKILRNEVKNFLKGNINVNDIEKVIKEKYNSNAYNTKRLVQDNICRVQEGANDVWQKEHGIEYTMYMATLDGHVCDKCKRFDREVYRIDEKPVELPQHPFDRCTYVSLPNKDWKPKMRLDNETKQNINWQSYQEWDKNNKKLLEMNLQLFAKKSNWSILQNQISSGVLNLNEAKNGMEYWTKALKETIKTPIEEIKNSTKSVDQYWHILEDHKEFLKHTEIDNILSCLKNPDEIRLSFGKNVYIKNINGKDLITIVHNDIITSYYPNIRYLNNNIRKKELVWQK